MTTSYPLTFVVILLTLRCYCGLPVTPNNTQPATLKSTSSDSSKVSGITSADAKGNPLDLFGMMGIPFSDVLMPAALVQTAYRNSNCKLVSSQDRMDV